MKSSPLFFLAICLLVTPTLAGTNQSGSSTAQDIGATWTEVSNLSVSITAGQVEVLFVGDGRSNKTGYLSQARIKRNGVIQNTFNLTGLPYSTSFLIFASLNETSATNTYAVELKAQNGSALTLFNWNFSVSNGGAGTGGAGNVSSVLCSPVGTLDCSGVDTVSIVLDPTGSNFRNDTVADLSDFVNNTFLPITTYQSAINCSALGNDYYTYWNGSANLCRQDQTSAFSIRANSDPEITGAATLADGAGITITQVGSTITITAPSAGVTNGTVDPYSFNLSNGSSGYVPESKLTLNYPTHAQNHTLNGTDHTGDLNWSRISGILMNLTNTTQITGLLADAYISSATIWNAKLDGASGSGPIVVTESPANTITISTTFTNATAQLIRSQVTGQITVDDNQNSSITSHVHEYVTFNATALSVTTGTLISGGYTDLDLYDNIPAIIQEASGATGIVALVNFTSPDTFNSLTIGGRYDGGQNHYMIIEAYNYNLSSWVTLASMQNSEINMTNTILFSDVDQYISGVTQIRFTHAGGTGNVNHRLYLDQVVLALANSGREDLSIFSNHVANSSNPHTVTRTQLGQDTIDDNQNASYQPVPIIITLSNGASAIETGYYDINGWGFNGTITDLGMDSRYATGMNISFLYNATGTPIYPTDEVAVIDDTVDQTGLSIPIALKGNWDVYVINNTGSVNTTTLRMIAYRS